MQTRPLYAEPPVDLNDAVTRALRASQMTHQELANEMKVSRQTLYMLLNGRRTMRPEWSAKLGQLFGGSATHWEVFGSSEIKQQASENVIRPVFTGGNTIQHGNASTAINPFVTSNEIIDGLKCPHSKLIDPYESYRHHGSDYCLTVSPIIPHQSGTDDSYIDIECGDVISMEIRETIHLPRDYMVTFSIANEVREQSLKILEYRPDLPPEFSGKVMCDIQNLGSRVFIFEKPIEILVATFRRI